MTDHVNEVSNAADPGQLVAGQMLAQQRESLGLSIEECAETLKLSVSKLQALESGDSKPFASEMFIRGYLKSYAKLLRLSEEEVIDCYQSQPGSSSSVHPLEAAEKTDSGKWWLPYVVGIIIIALWFALSSYQSFQLAGQSDRQVEESSAGIDSESVRVNTAESAENQESLAALTDDVDSAASTDALEGESEAGALPVEIEGVAAEQQTSIESGIAESDLIENGVIEVGIVEENAETLPLEQAIDQVEGEVSGEIESAAEESAATILSSEERIRESSVGDDTLFFTFAEDCWVEVVDASETIIFSDLRRASSTLTVKGDAPFSVVLGNISGTTLSFNNEPVELSNSRDGRTLRLTLDTNS